ncbi:MAG: glycoside hydrolase family 15 protein [Nakamurella sp.]
MTSEETDTWEFPPYVLREYALLADGQRGAMIGPRGDVSWMCAPRWDSDAVFSSLIGGHGMYAITPVGRFVWGGSYEPGSLIWHSRWVTETGTVQCREALAFPGEPGRVVLLRRVEAIDGDARVRVLLDPRAGFGHDRTRRWSISDGYWTGRSGPLYVRWSGGADARPRGKGKSEHVLVLELTVPAGAHHDFVLELSDTALPDDAVDPARAWRATETAWRGAVPELDNTVSPTEARHSYAVLRGLTSHGGGMVAAATMSLPERANAGRNYDYRYVWIRDQCYAGQAVAAAGPHPLLDDAVRFVSERIHADGPNLTPAYTINGGPVPDQRSLDLPGYPGGSDMVGNWVNQQFQLDALGEALLLLSAAARHDRLDADGWRAVHIAAQAIAQRWTEPDAGIWEIDNRAWTHSRLICAAGLRAAAHASSSAPLAADWSALADKIVANTARTSLHPSGRWQRSPDDEGLDASLLLPPLRGALAADDPRTTATLNAYLAELTDRGYAYRFRHDQRPLADAEGAFLLCGFITALAQHQQGDEVSAFRWFERNAAACGPPGLFTEEFDVNQRQLRGNIPQAFVHALLLESAARLTEPWKPF